MRKPGSCINVGAQVANADAPLFCTTNVPCEFKLTNNIEIFDHIRGFVFGKNTQVFAEEDFFISEKQPILVQLYNFFFFDMHDAVISNSSSIVYMSDVQCCGFLDFRDMVQGVIDAFWYVVDLIIEALSLGSCTTKFNNDLKQFLESLYFNTYDFNPQKSFFNKYLYDFDFFKHFRTSNILSERLDLFDYFTNVFNVITFETDVCWSICKYDSDIEFAIGNSRVSAYSDTYGFLESLGNFYQTFFRGAPAINARQIITSDGYIPHLTARDLENFTRFSSPSDFNSFFGNFVLESTRWEVGFYSYDNYQPDTMLNILFYNLYKFFDYFFNYTESYILVYSDFTAKYLLFYNSFDFFVIIFFFIFLIFHGVFFYIFNFFVNNSVIAPIFNVLFILVTNICLMLVVTLIIAALTLIERKFLSLTQRRVGPYYVGYRGRLQYIADALKLFLKGATVHNEANKFWFYAVPSVCCVICYFFWMNSVWCPSVSLLEIEYNLVYATLLSVSFGFCIILLGYFSGNKYSRLASIRAAVAMLNLELFLGLMMLSLVFISESFCLSVFVVYQESIWLIFTFFGMCGLISLTFMLEVARTPFDVAEAESELVTGYSTEIGSFMFGIYYLGEYFHLFFFSAVISILFLGGWEGPNFLLYLILPAYLPF